MFGKRFVSVSEPEQSSKLKESRVKELTGESVITARRMKEDFWTFKRTHKFWLSTNHLPRITGSDDAIWRRIKVIPFRVDLRVVTTPIPNLDQILVEDEGAGILNWLVAGYRDYLQNGFLEPELVRVATNTYRHDEDDLANFIKSECTIDDSYVVSANDLFTAYKQWGGTLSQTCFGKMISKTYNKDRPNEGVYRKITVYRGIGLEKNDAADMDGFRSCP